MVTTVLVVDDEPSIRELLRRWLEGWGYAVTLAGNATDALERMRAEPASIILVDITMPGHDGFWLVEHVRAQWSRTAIIMATAADDLDLVLKSKRAGAVDYVLKPFGRELLRQALARAEASLRSSTDHPIPRGSTKRQMIWLFERDDESLRLETRYDNDTAEFLLVTHSPDGRERTERFTDAMSFRQRLEGLERQFDAEHWTQHGPTFLRDGWKL